MASTVTSTPRELELLEKLNKLEADRVKFLSIVQGKVKQLEQELEVSSMQHFYTVIKQQQRKQNQRENTRFWSKKKKSSTYAIL